ncbi:Myc box-dependent-interacting protein 1 [Dissostichus eleginoides]|uniref:Myc box-dependent-interacting protein 1 n=1 Tax=Dissostichus eleginoides TaxID=100907 RepID=A0AAD9CNR1_DISEL|nr:Myc box-dependent-interacting protein 1 [Dissostichus eleginoides]
MAELNLGKGLTAGKVASNVQKKLTRAQEKVLQKLGKADETKDIAFEEEVINFNKQYTEGSKLQRDLRAYLEAVKAMHESSKNVQGCLADMYEPEWYGKKEVDSIAEDCDVLWTDYHQKLVDHALISMDTYLGQFPDIKSRIAKRDRKLVDYDSARHNYATTHKTKKKDGGIKITKPSSLLERATPGWAQGILSAHNVAQSSLSRSQAEEELDRAQKVFEEINIDLQEELPSLWNSRVGFYVSTFQSLSGFEEKFHKEIGRLDQDLHDVLDTLEDRGTEAASRKTESRGASSSGTNRSASGKEAANHSLRPGGPPPIPKSPSKLRPAMPPPPKVTPCKELKTENIISMFDAAAAPDISVTSPTECDSPAVSSLLDMDLDSFSATTKASTVTQPANWDSWHEESDAQEEYVEPHYDPVIAAVTAWGDDGTQPVRYDPIAAAQDGWGDDGTVPVRIDPVAPVVEVGGDEANNYPEAEAKEDWGDDGGPTEEVAPPEEVTPLEEVAPPEEVVPPETPAAESPIDAAEEEGTPAAAAVDDEEGQGESAAAAAAPEEEAPAEETPEVAAPSTEVASEPADIPPGFLFKLLVMHDYAANDTDELEMKTGDVVLVISFENPDEQDDGWLMGMKEDDWKQNKENAAKGVFPENFTQRL